MKQVVKKFKQLSLLFTVLLLTNCQVDDIIVNEKPVEKSIQKGNAIKYVSLSLIPEIKDQLEGIKRIKKEKSFQNKSISDFEINEKKIVELIQENGDRNYSFIIEKAYLDNEPYIVENLNIMVKNGEYQSFITKWIPADGKEFYNIKKFIGEVQYLDLNGKIIHSFNYPVVNKASKSLLQYAFTIGCYGYVIASFDNESWFVYSSENICGGGGGTTVGGTTGGGTTTDSTTGSWGLPSGSGGGGYSGGGTTSIVPNIPTQDEVEIKKYNTFLSSLTTSQYNYLAQHQIFNDVFFQYLLNNFFSITSKNFEIWSINYMLNHLDIDFPTFQNQFMGVSEGQDDSYDSTFWENPNLTFPQQSLPSYINFVNAFPRNTDGTLMSGADNIYNYVGGYVLQKRLSLPLRETNNTCALKVSRALNYSGIIIPNIPGQTIKGSDQKNYFLNSKKLNIWMRKTFGVPTGSNHITGSQAGVHGVNLPSLLNGKKGIYSLVSSDITWAYGHADFLISNSTCGVNCHFYDAPIDYIDIWILN